MIIQIIGQAGSGKTTLAVELADRINAIHINADKVRADLNKDLGFELSDRIENARRLGALARLLDEQGQIVVVDFICPTQETRDAFGVSDFVVWVNRIKEGRFVDTNKMWQDPVDFDIEIILKHTY
jgi:adenylylsulfate kinase-like enzyme